MEKKIAELILPSNLLSNFEVLKIEESPDLKEGGTKIEIYLEEKNILPVGYSFSDYETKDILPAKTIQDFPIRGKAVYLLIRRRRWRNKENPQDIICNDYSHFAEGSKLTKELSDFLKATGRDPERYD